MLLQGMHSHDVEQILQGCHRIENELLHVGAKAGIKVGLCHDSLKCITSGDSDSSDIGVSAKFG
jgi:hypothetical protein